MDASRRSAAAISLMASFGLALSMAAATAFAQSTPGSTSVAPVGATWGPGDEDKRDFRNLSLRLEKRARFMMALDANCKTLAAIVINTENRDEYLPDQDMLEQSWDNRVTGLKKSGTDGTKCLSNEKEGNWEGLASVSGPKEVCDVNNESFGTDPTMLEGTVCKVGRSKIKSIVVLNKKMEPLLFLAGSGVDKVFPEEIPGTYLVRVRKARSTCSPVTPSPCRSPRKATQVLVNGKYSCLCL